MPLDRAFMQVAEFHRAFGHPCAAQPKALGKDRREVRADWMREEIQEWLRAEDIVDQADAMVDLIYFALGSLVELGVRPEGLFEIVHKANMAKLWPDGSPQYGENGKVRKPTGWYDPEQDLRAAIATQANGKPEAAINAPAKECIDSTNLCLASCISRVIATIEPESSVNEQAVADALGGARSGTSDRETGIPVEPEKIRHIVEQAVGRHCTVTYSTANTFEEWEFRERVKEAFDTGAHVICTLSAGRLFGHARVDLGHSVVAERLFERDRMLHVYDPGPDGQGSKDYSCEDMYWAARAREGGLIVIKPMS